MKDPVVLEQMFKEAVGGLSNYKRANAWEYVNHLREQIAAKDKEIGALADELVKTEAR